MSRTRADLCLVAVGFLALLSGCGKQGPTLADINDTNAKKVRGAYGLFMAVHGMRGPKDEQEFKDFLKNNQGATVRLGRMGVTPDQIDAMFVSERDGQPFKVRYGLRGMGDHAIVFESEGVGGKRIVALGIPREVDDAEYEQLWNKKRPEPAGLEL